MSQESTQVNRAPEPWSPRRDPVVWIILLVHLALGVTYGFVMELGYGPDEITRHYPYVQWLAEERTLPPADTHGKGSLDLHPPLYYLALTPLYAATHPFGNRVALRALRCTSPPLILVSMLFWLAVIHKACGGRREPTLFALALTAWWPNVFVAAGTLNNDVGAILTSAAILYVMCVRCWSSRTLQSAVLFGVLVGVGGLVKSSVLTTFLPVMVVVIAWQHGRRFWADGRFWTRFMSGGAACVAVCGWWYVRNLDLYGQLIPVPSGYSLLPEGLSKLDALTCGLVWPLALRAVNGLWVSVFAGAVWFPDWSHPAVYGALRIVTVLGIAGVAIGLWRLATGRVRFAAAQAPAIVVPAATLGFIYLSAIYTSVFIHAGVYQGGRYLLVALPGLTIPLALALRQVFPRSCRRPLMVLVVLLFLTLNFLAWYHLVTYWNPYVLSQTGRYQ